MDRRVFIGTLAGLIAAPFVVEAQPAKVPRYVEGRTYILEPRWADGRIEPIPRLAAELVGLKVDVIVSTAGPAAAVVKDATTSIPIVLASIPSNCV